MLQGCSAMDRQRAFLGGVPLACERCGRQVYQTIHHSRGFEVDYYLYFECDPPAAMVTCKDCIRDPQTLDRRIAWSAGRARRARACGQN